MKTNADTVLVGRNVLLVPYKCVRAIRQSGLLPSAVGADLRFFAPARLVPYTFLFSQSQSRSEIPRVDGQPRAARDDCLGTALSPRGVRNAA